MFELTTAIFLILSAFYGAPNQINTNANEAGEAALVRGAGDIPMSLEPLARSYFKNDKVLLDIARCESGFRHYNADGTVVRGNKNKQDVGLMQINEYYHGETALKMGMDVTTPEGNLSYARWLFERQGTAPWNTSAKCWAKEPPLAKVVI